MANPIVFAAVATAASAAVSAVGSISQGIAASNAAEHNAELAERDAAIQAEQGKFERDRIRRDSRTAIAQQRAAAARGGGGLEGSPLLLMAETAAESELDILASRGSQQGGQDTSRAEASAARAEGSAARGAGFVGAGASLLTGASRVGSLLNEE